MADLTRQPLFLVRKRLLTQHVHFRIFGLHATQRQSHKHVTRLQCDVRSAVCAGWSEVVAIVLTVYLRKYNRTGLFR
jgi:hypothetical protein